ncbi:MAG TPA: hypothetical protein VK087_03915 [Tissierellaceae bacterium]|nr:hypothetical protein [Tissierellaceae bacterium]
MDGLYYIVYFTIIDILKTFTSPFFILILLMVFLQYYKRIDKPIKATLNSMMFGILGGVIGTVVFIYLEIYIIPKDFIYIFIVAIVLSLIDPRLVCFAYGGSLVVLSNLIIGYPDIDAYKFMIVISVLHLIESLLILINGAGQKKAEVFNINGRLDSGYNFIRFWPLPLVIFIGDTIIKPVTLLAMLNYSDFTISDSPKIKTIKTSIMLFFYSIILFIITKIDVHPFLPPIFAILGHEFIMSLNKYKEYKSFKRESS